VIFNLLNNFTNCFGQRPVSEMQTAMKRWSLFEMALNEYGKLLNTTYPMLSKLLTGITPVNICLLPQRLPLRRILPNTPHWLEDARELL
jgi:hypothetical protein